MHIPIIFSTFAANFRLNAYFMTKNITPPPTKAFAQPRQSNIELLRIVCMFFIVFHHFLVHAVFPDSLDSDASLNSGNTISIITNGFLYIGVNCFILISGFYGVKLRWKNIASLFIACALYGVLGYLFHLWYNGSSIGKNLIYNSVFIFSHSSWWYINCYVILLLVSPLLNAGISIMTKRQHIITITGLTLCQVYFGYYWREAMFDDSGYNFMQFLYMYIIGAYIHKHVSITKEKRYTYLCIYIVCALIWGILSCIGHSYAIEGWWNPVCYNNPIVILAAVAFFLFFQTFSFENKMINWLAPGTLAAYLIQDQYYFGHAIYESTQKITDTLSPYAGYAIAVLISIAFLLAAMLIDKGRAWLTRPLIDWVNKIDKKIPLN